jgi:HK97 family phage major capsid protein
MADEKLPGSLEEFQKELTAIADTEGTLNDEQVQRYKVLEVGMVALRDSEEIKRKNKTWNAPRVSLIPPAPKGDDALEYAFEAYMRTGQKNADMAGREINGLPGYQQYDQTITTTAGGYLIPPGFEQKIVIFKKNYGGIASVVDHLPTATGQPLQYPSNDDTANSAEIDAVNVGMSSAGADLVFAQVTLSAYSYMAGGTSNAALHVPFELAQDSTFPIVPFVTERLGTRLGRKMALDLAIGTGSSQPKGLFDRIPDVNLLSGNFTQTAAVNYGQLTGALAVSGGGQGVMFTLDPDYLPNATWIMRYSTLGILASITDTTGRPIFIPFGDSSFMATNIAPGGGTAGEDGSGYRPVGTLIGFPVVVDQAAPAVANASIAKPGAALDAFISFGDHRQAYVVRDVQGITLLVDPYTAMAKRQIGYFTWARQDATIQNAKAHVLLAGWNAA